MQGHPRSMSLKKPTFYIKVCTRAKLWPLLSFKNLRLKNISIFDWIKHQMRVTISR